MFSLLTRSKKSEPKCDRNIAITADPSKIIQDNAFCINYEIHVFKNRIVWIAQEHFMSSPKMSST